jgi:hypothetical protein
LVRTWVCGSGISSSLLKKAICDSVLEPLFPVLGRYMESTREDGLYGLQKTYEKEVG